jgi:hypothetical protein
MRATAVEPYTVRCACGIQVRSVRRDWIYLDFSSIDPRSDVANAFTYLGMVKHTRDRLGHVSAPARAWRGVRDTDWRCYL